jgi:NAD(P)-dependent dehydrogenase (short-subunit alcohol dehydrogenase family)
MLSGSLRGRVAVITGSTSGIGLGIARVLASKGCDLVINGLEGAAVVNSIVEELRRANGSVPRARRRSVSRAWVSVKLGEPYLYFKLSCHVVCDQVASRWFTRVPICATRPK